ncbi:MAG TPA: sulfur carrier protein ThiS [Luteimonas sp.]
MDIILNGQSLPLPDQTTLAALLEAQHLAQRRVAVEINGEIIPRSLHAEHVLAAGDKVEIVHALGGG